MEKNTKIISLGPTSNANNIKIYKEYFDDIFNENEIDNEIADENDNANNIENNVEFELKDNIIAKKQNKNIAISGGYASGKSSIVKTYFSSNKFRDKVLYVSLGDYIEESNKEDDEIKIQTSILQQIIYSKMSELNSLSRIDRIDYKKGSIIIMSLLYSVLISSLVTIITYFKYKEHITFLEMGDNNFNTLLFIILFLLFFLIIYSLGNKLSIKKIGFGDNDIEFFKSSELSILNKYIDELLYFFNENIDIEFIVFEDIDRLKNSVKIFTKLREINTILNNYYKDRTIRFVYLIKDDIFESSEVRSKFFDCIIPIVPYSSGYTIKNKFKELFKDMFNNNELDCINYLSRYVENIREVYDIYNEYNIYENIYCENFGNKNIPKKEICTLCTYKVLYPKKYDFFTQSKGLLSYYLSNDFENYYMEHKTSIENRIKFIETIYEKYRKDKQPVETKTSNNESDANLNQSKILPHDEDLNQDEDFKMSKIGLYYDKSMEEYKLNDFEKEIIEFDLINKNYKKIIVCKNLGNITLNDYEIIDDIENKRAIGYDRKINNPHTVLDEISIYDFRNSDICNKFLFDFVLISKKKNEYLSEFFCGMDNEKIKFLSEYNNIKIYDFDTYKLFNYVDNMLMENIGTKEDQIIILSRIIKLKEYNNMTPKIKETIETNPSIFEHLENDFPKLIEYIKYKTSNDKNVKNSYYQILENNLKSNNILFKQKEINKKYKNIINLVLSNSLYDFNFELVDNITPKENKFNKKDIIKSFNNMDNDYCVKRFYKSNMINFTNKILEYDEKQKTDEKQLIRFVKENSEISENIINIIKKINIIINDIDNFDIKYYDELINNKLIKLNINNLYKMSNKGYNIDNILNERIESVLEFLTKKNLSIKRIRNVIIDNDNISFDNYKKYIERLDNLKYKIDNISTIIDIDKLKLIVGMKNYIANKDDTTYLLTLPINEDIMEKIYEKIDEVNVNKLDIKNIQLLINISDNNYSKYNKLIKNKILEYCENNTINNKELILKLTMDFDFDLVRRINVLQKNILFINIKNDLSKCAKSFGEEYYQVVTKRKRIFSKAKINENFLVFLKDKNIEYIIDYESKDSNWKIIYNSNFKFNKDKIIRKN